MTGQPRRLLELGALGVWAALLATSGTAQTADDLARQREQYDAVAAKSVLDLQPFRHEVSAVDPRDGRTLRFTSLHPAINAWFLLQTETSKAGVFNSYHLENPYPGTQGVRLDTGAEPTLVFTDGPVETRCAPFAEADAELHRARDSALPYAPICDGRLYLRNRVSGSRTNLESWAEFLRDNVWGGEDVVRIVRDNLFRDSQLETSKQVGTNGQSHAATGPAPMQVSDRYADHPVITTLLDMGLTGTKQGQMALGLWYPVTGLNGVFASAFQPRAVSGDILKGPGKVNALGGIEARATGYVVAFDLGQYDINYALGTDHPSLGWSSRPPGSVRPRGLKGPDGISTAKPLVALGMVNPVQAGRTIAIFTGGFKRQHGAFKYGDMASFNYGHHYGFIENGVILSKLQPGLSTLFGLTDGTVRMKTWTAADNALLNQIRFARQNGVPLIETDPATGHGVPGDRVTKWGPGNWSGSAKAELRTLRAGACMIRQQDTQFLLYGYFSTATPSAMARTFQAYGCDYAMLLDMNALEHTYLAVYARDNGTLNVGHMVPGMSLIDKKARDGTLIPRFLGYVDNRDLFYLTRKEALK